VIAVSATRIGFFLGVLVSLWFIFTTKTPRHEGTY